MKSFFPKALTEASKINCDICQAITERQLGNVKTFLKLAEETRDRGLTEVSKQFVTPIDREDIASLFTLSYELAFGLGDTASLASGSGLYKTASELLKTTEDNCNTVFRILSKDRLPPPELLLGEYGLSRATALKPTAQLKDPAGRTLYLVAKKCEDTSFRMIDYILRSSIKNN